MSLHEEISTLQRSLEGRTDWRADYARLVLERLVLQVELDAERVQARLQHLSVFLEEPRLEKIGKSPLRSLFEALEERLKDNLKVREYESLERAIQGTGDRQAAWTELLARLEPALIACQVPRPGKQKPPRRQDELSMRVLLRLAQSERGRPPAEVRADREELRLARDDRRRGVARLERLLQRLEQPPS